MLGRDFWTRFVQLQLGLVGFGFSLALMVRSRLGLGPWDVLHQGLARVLDTSIGLVVIGTGGLVLLLWIPLRQRPGIGTLLNVVVVGLVVDGSLSMLSNPGTLLLRGVFISAGIVMNGIATGLYIGAGLGPGPRDGLMTGLARRGHSIRVVRTTIEIVVLAAGVALGGTIGIGTVLYALSIGPLAHYFLPLLSRPVAPGTRNR
jgi:uncharacterized membrane protein YczE